MSKTVCMRITMQRVTSIFGLKFKLKFIYALFIIYL